MCRVTPLTSNAMSSSICHEGQGGREGHLEPGRGEVMVGRRAGYYARELVLWPPFLPILGKGSPHLCSFIFPASSFLPLSPSLSMTSLLLLNYITLSKLLKLSKPVFPLCKTASTTSEGCENYII